MSLLIKHLILNKSNYVKLCIGTRLLVDFFSLEVHSEGTTYLIYAHALKIFSGLINSLIIVIILNGYGSTIIR